MCVCVCVCVCVDNTTLCLAKIKSGSRLDGLLLKDQDKQHTTKSDNHHVHIITNRTLLESAKVMIAHAGLSNSLL